MSHQIFNYQRRIYLKDTDAAGVVYFTQGLTICHEAYEASLAESGISLQQTITAGKTALPIVHAEIDWLRPLFCGDRIQVKLNTRLVNSSEFAIDYQISPTDKLEQIVVQAQTRHVCINPQLRQRADLPEAMLNWLNYSQQERM